MLDDWTCTRAQASLLARLAVVGLYDWVEVFVRDPEGVEFRLDPCEHRRVHHVFASHDGDAPTVEKPCAVAFVHRHKIVIVGVEDDKVCLAGETVGPVHPHISWYCRVFRFQGGREGMHVLDLPAVEQADLPGLVQLEGVVSRALELPQDARVRLVGLPLDHPRAVDPVSVEVRQGFDRWARSPGV